jgi:hypothetical protein
MTTTATLIAITAFLAGLLMGRRGPLIVNTTWYTETEKKVFNDCGIKAEKKMED